MKAFIRTILSWLLRVRVAGDIAACERERRLLIVANFPSRAAGLLIGLYLPRQPLVVLPEGKPRGVLERVLLRLVPHLELDISDPRVIKRVSALLREGRPLVMFPEGYPNSRRSVLKIFPVSALAATRNRAAILPVFISVARGRLTRLAALLTPPRFSLQLLSPVWLESAAGKSARARRAYALQQLTRIMQQVKMCSFERKPLFESFLDAAAMFGRRRQLLEDHNEQMADYGALLKGSLVISRWIRWYSVPRDNVGILLPNLISSVCTVLGVSAAGRVPSILNFTAGAAAVKTAAVAANVRTIVTSSTFIEKANLEPLLEALDGYHILYLEDIRSELGLVDKLWLSLFALWFPRKVIAKPTMSDPAVVLFTSGSEDWPKGVVLSHDAIVANIAQICSVFDFSAKEKIFNPLPMYHAYSFTAGVMLSILTGTRMLLYVSPLRYRAIPQIFYRRKCSVLYGTSTFLSYYAQNADPMDFHNLRYVIAGGEKLSPEVASVWMKKFGVRLYEGYGATEAAPVISLSCKISYREGCVGRFLPGVEYRIRPLEGILRGGALHIKGPNLMLGYYRHSRPGLIEAPRSAFGGGWYDTGDIAEVDDDGMVTIIGRSNRFVKVAGEMVSLNVMERIARIASPDHQHAVIALLNENGPEATVLFTTDESLTRARMLAAARSSGIPDLAVARKLVRVPEIPVLSTGKTDYLALRALLDSYGKMLTKSVGRAVLPMQDL